VGAAYRYTQLVQSGSQPIDVDAHLAQWTAAGWDLHSYSSAATMTPGGLGMGGLRVFHNFVWMHEPRP